ncbi:hypothetical protein L3Q82_010915, partial [Scortum barcoo]
MPRLDHGYYPDLYRVLPCYHNLCGIQQVQVLSASSLPLGLHHRPPPSVPPSRRPGCTPSQVQRERPWMNTSRSGIICPSSSPARAGFFFVGKKDGLLQQARVFTMLDLWNAYHLVKIREGDEWKTGFNTPTGHYKYLLMPFGLTNTPAWGPKAEEAFQRLKRLFTAAPVLTMPDPHLLFIVEVDASNEGVGAGLFQCSPSDNHVHPCAFLSCKLSLAEHNYDVGNRELLAIKVALEEWHHWLEGAELPFIVWTDHKNLQYLKLAKTELSSG